jgi:hypothetical protein
MSQPYPFLQPHSILSHSLHDEISTLPPSAKWSISSVTATDNGKVVADAIKAGTALLVSVNNKTHIVVNFLVFMVYQ